VSLTNVINLNDGQAAPGKKKIFLFLGNAEVAELLSLTLDSRFHCDVSTFTSAIELVEALKTQRFDLAVLDFSLGEGMVVFEKAHNDKIPMVLYHPEGNSPEVRGPKMKVFRDNALLQGILQGVEQIGAFVKEGASDPTSDYVAVSTPLFLRATPLVTDTFVKLSGSKFLKILHKGDLFTYGDLKKYQAKKISHLYVPKTSIGALQEKLSMEMEILLGGMSREPRAEPTKGTDSVEAFHDLARNLGFTREVQELVKRSMTEVVEEMQKSPSLAGILANMELAKEKYIAAHSQMLAEVSCALAIAMEWGSDMSLKKIAMAALLHDMSLDDHNLCRVKSAAEFDERQGEFTTLQVEEYKSHTKRAAVLIQGMKEVPADVDKIVYQHHELPTGTGFPEAVSHFHIHPLAATLMVAHDLVDWVIDHPGPVDMPAFAEAHRQKYSVGVFKKILKALEALQV